MDATLVTGWSALCQLLASAFTQPTYVTFLHIATGWVLCRSKPTVTNLVCTIGRSLLGHAAKHWTVYERFFYRAAWSLPEVSYLLLVRVVVPLIESLGVEKVIDLKIDDTTCGRCGKHVAFASYFKDASVSNTLKPVIHWSHNWVIGCVGIRTRFWPNWVIGLAVWFALYRKPADVDQLPKKASGFRLPGSRPDQRKDGIRSRHWSTASRSNGGRFRSSACGIT